MKIMAQLAVIGALVAGATALNAQTNIDLNVNIALTGVVQTGDSTAARGKIATKDVIQAVAPGASARAKLLARYAPEGGDPVFIVRDGGTDTEISTDTLSSSLVGNSVSTTTTRGDINTVKTAEIRRFALSTDTINFDVQGYTTSTADNKGLARGEIFDNTSPTAQSAKVAGNMTDSSGNPGVCSGTISLSGRKITETP
jgi:hypothetical protein